MKTDGEAAWRTFEQAVAAFLQSLDPKAKVRHDAHTPDMDTGRLRQRDVWIDTAFGGHLPITILVSCKRKTAKLSQQDVDAFVGELRSSGANKGVLYAFSGFSNPALEKAAKLGISCCTLLVDQPPPVPEMLTFEAYCFREQYQVEVSGTPEPVWDIMPDLFEATMIDDSQATTMLDILATRYDLAREQAVVRLSEGVERPIWWAEIEIPPEGQRPWLTVGIRSNWAVYRARFEGWRLNGSYTFTDAKFAGSFSTPWIDQQSTHPGPGWEKIDLDAVRPSGTVISSYCHGGDIRADVRELYDTWRSSA